MKLFSFPWQRTRGWFFAVALAGFLTGYALAQFVDVPPARRPDVTDLNQQVATALEEHQDSAARYAAFYRVLAGRFARHQYKTTSRAAEVASRAADILNLPGVLKDIVAKQLNPILGTPGKLTAQQSETAAQILLALSTACQEVSP